jgi:hypothetical protein
MGWWPYPLPTKLVDWLIWAWIEIIRVPYGVNYNQSEMRWLKLQACWWALKLNFETCIGRWWSSASRDVSASTESSPQMARAVTFDRRRLPAQQSINSKLSTSSKRQLQWPTTEHQVSICFLQHQSNRIYFSLDSHHKHLWSVSLRGQKQGRRPGPDHRRTTFTRSEDSHTILFPIFSTSHSPYRSP